MVLLIVGECTPLSISRWSREEGTMSAPRRRVAINASRYNLLISLLVKNKQWPRRWWRGVAGGCVTRDIFRVSRKIDDTWGFIRRALSSLLGRSTKESEGQRSGEKTQSSWNLEWWILLVGSFLTSSFKLINFFSQVLPDNNVLFYFFLSGRKCLITEF